MKRSHALLALGAVLALLWQVHGVVAPASLIRASSKGDDLPGALPPSVEFHDIAEQAGLNRSFPNGGVDSKTYILETTGSGIAFLDYDNDGFLDIFVVSGPGGSNRLYHND